MATASVAPAAPEHSAKPTRALVGVAFALALANAFTTFEWSDTESLIQFAVVYGLLAFEPIAFGVWVALGHGPILKRAVIAAPMLLLLFISPGYVPHTFDDVRQFEFTQMVLVGFAALVASSMIFLVFRAATGFRILPVDAESQRKVDIRFSIRQLLGLTTLYAVALGLTTSLNLDSKPRSGDWIFGPDFYLYIFWVGGSFLASIILPTIAVPLFILHGHPSRRAVKVLVLVWVCITLAICTMLKIYDNGGFWEFLWSALLTQLCAAIIGGLTAIWLRFNGLRLVRPPRSEPVNSTIVLPSP